MCNHEKRLALREHRDRLLDARLVFGVGKGCSFVEHHDGRIFQNGTGKHYALLFATGKIRALRSDEGFQTSGQTVDDFTALREVYRPVYLFCRCFGIAVTQVLY